jgi:hypothetical protein
MEGWGGRRDGSRGLVGVVGRQADGDCEVTSKRRVFRRGVRRSFGF